MDHGINAGRRRVKGGQAASQFGIEDDEISIKLTGYDTHLGGFASGQDRDVGHFRAGARSGWNLDQWQAAALYFANTV